MYLSILSGNAQDLYVATRASTSDVFGAPTALTTVNSGGYDNSPTVSADGLTLLFQSTRDGAFHIYIATRSSTQADFGTPTLASELNSTTTSDTDGQPYLSADGSEVWFDSTRSGGAGAGDIYRATVSATGFGAPVHVGELATPSDDWLPVLSADRLTIYFASTRTDGGALGDFDIWTAHRTSVSDGFAAPTDVTELNTASGDYPTWLSADNCRLYMESTRGGNFDLYVATRTP